ncbi:MAG: PAS domain-containing protein [Candidatus Accumulibacter sp.]|nr:PAS domain-containing protein [Accumulibacter sp.]
MRKQPPKPRSSDRDSVPAFLADGVSNRSWFYDEDNHIIDCNNAALRVFGVGRKSEFIRIFHQLFPEFQPD